MRALVAPLVHAILAATVVLGGADAHGQVAGAAPDPAGDPRPVVDPAAAPAADPAADPMVALGLGTVVARVDRGTTAYLALAQGGVAVVDVSAPGAPRLVSTLLPGHAVSRLLLDGDRLWAVVLTESAHAFAVADPAAPVALLPGAAPSASAPSASTPSAPTPSAPTPSAPTPVPRAKVLEVSGGRVIFDGGSARGFAAGMHVKVVSQRLVTKPDLVKGGVAQVPSGEVTAVVAIEELAEGRAMAVLGRGDVALAGDLVVATDDELSESLFLPRRAPFHWSLGFMARPFLGVGAPGIYPVGGLVDGYARYTFDAVPVALGVEMAPMGFAVLTRDLHYPGTFALTASYVTDYFEIGLGGGALVGNAGPCAQGGTLQDVDTDDDGIPDTPRFVPDGEPVCEENNGATFNQVLRLGAYDGLRFSWSSSIFARPEGFVLGVGRGEVAVPVSSSLGLFGAGGVGESGWAFGEVGVRSLFGGTGAPGTVILSASLGVSAVFDGAGTFVEEQGGYASYQREVVVGPAVGFGMEWRL